MNMDITKEEYRYLLDLLHMAHWIMHGHRTEADPREAKYDKLIQKIYGLAKAMGQDHLIEYSSSADRYSPSAEFEEITEAWAFIDEFTDDLFWDQLIHRMTERDLSRTFGGYEQLDKLSMQERFVAEGPILERYTNEFDGSGLERLEIVEHFGPSIAMPIKTSD
jgi:hypothetical protein